MTKTHTQVGDYVQFVGGRGQIVKGVVTKIASKVHRKNIKFARSHGINLPYDLQATEYALVKPDGVEGFYKVGLSALKTLHKTKGKTVQKARQGVERVSQAIKDRNWHRKNVSQNISFDRGLHTLKYGDKVTVQFRNGTSERTFVRRSASGQIRVEILGMGQWIAPQFVAKKS